MFKTTASSYLIPMPLNRMGCTKPSSRFVRAFRMVAIPNFVQTRCVTTKPALSRGYRRYLRALNKLFNGEVWLMGYALSAAITRYALIYLGFR